jgi:hypothetical protein
MPIAMFTNCTPIPGVRRIEEVDCRTISIGNINNTSAKATGGRMDA